MSVMPRPKPAVPLVMLGAKVPKTYIDALPALIAAWHADVIAKLAAQKIHTGPPADRTALVKAMLDEFFDRYGVKVERGEAPATAKPRAAKRPT